MTIREVTDRSDPLLAQLLTVWEESVRATHDFLTEAEISTIKAYVPEALAAVPHLVVAEEAGMPCGFMGLADDCLEMLFLAPQARGKGMGKALLTFAINEAGVRYLTVNEQNPQAVGFYEHMGFRVVKRTATDEQGQPFPILYMSLAQ